MKLSLFASSDHFTFFTTFLHLDEKYMHVVMAGLVTIGIALLSIRVHRSYQQLEGDPLVPSPSLSLRNIVELAVEQLYKMFEGLLGAQAKEYFPLLGTVFLFVFFNNLTGLFPGFLPATQDPSTNFALALPVFLIYNYKGVKEHGFVAYAKHFMGPILLLAPLIILIELIGHMVRPVSLSLRLLGNISGDHMVLGIFSDLTPLVVPVIFFGLGLFVAFLQAFVFTLLSTIYISQAISHDH